MKVHPSLSNPAPGVGISPDIKPLDHGSGIGDQSPGPIMNQLSSDMGGPHQKQDTHRKYEKNGQQK